MKKVYKKPKMNTKKLTRFFFACVIAARGCSSVVANRNPGAGCPTA